MSHSSPCRSKHELECIFNTVLFHVSAQRGLTTKNEIDLDPPKVRESAQATDEEAQSGATKIMMKLKEEMNSERASDDGGISVMVDDTDKLFTGLFKCSPQFHVDGEGLDHVWERSTVNPGNTLL